MCRPYELAAWPSEVLLETENREIHFSIVGGKEGLIGLGEGGGLAGELGEAAFVEGAFGALGFVDGGRGGLGLEELMDGGDGGLGLGAEFVGEFHLATALTGGVKDGASGDVEAEHFLEAKGLGAELGVVVVEFAALAFFVFDGVEGLDGFG